MTHAEVVQAAYVWVLKRAACGIAFKELKTLSDEIPDVIGFGSWDHSVLIECKVSRSDFICDKNKRFRKDPERGMGMYRFYACPTGMIKIDELPENWGLIYVDDKLKAKSIHNPYGLTLNSNIFRGGFTTRNIIAEKGIMYSALRRLFIKGHVKHIYDKQYNNSTTPAELIELNELKSNQ